MKKIYIIDSSGYIFRAFYAVRSLTTKSGFPTNALYGFLKMYLKLLNSIESDYIVSVFDTGKKNFRHELYNEYKANRAKCPEELAVQMPFFRDFVRAFGMKVLEKEGFEADDIIATVTKKAHLLGFEVEVVSADKDLMQLVDDSTTIWDTMKDKHYDKEGVKEKLGIFPEKVGDYLALVGDTSDNVPGIRGLGPKTAITLLEKYGNIENLLSSLDEIENDKGIRGAKTLVENIKENKETLFLSRSLVDLEKNVPLFLDDKDFSSFNEDDFSNFFKKEENDFEPLSKLANEFEFQSLLKDQLESKEKKSDEKVYQYKMVLEEDFDDFLGELMKQSFFAFDTETTSLNTVEARLVGVSFCWNQSEAFYVPLSHIELFAENHQIPMKKFISSVKGILENKDIKKTGHNLKYDIQIFKNYNVTVSGVAFDSMIAAYLLSPDETSFSLSSVSKRYLGLNASEYKDVAGKSGDFSQVDIASATSYSAEDSHFSWLLYVKLNLELKEKGLLNVFYDIDLPLIDVLANMELNGVFIDTSLLGKISIFLQKELEEAESSIYELAGCHFNINSPKQLGVILFENLKISTFGLKKTQSGFSTDVTTLEKLKNIHPIAEKLLKYRAIFKLKSTYVDALPSFVSLKTGRLHTKYNQAVTGTGRLSSSDPNLQNIPIRTKEGKEIRSAFCAPKGKIIISADYSQVELRVLAHMSQDEALIEAFKNGEDIHTNTSKFIFDLKEDEIPTAEQRRLGKVINFGVVYGMSAFRLSKELNISVSLATKYIEGFFIKYRGVKAYFDKLLQDVEKDGYVSTMFGRKRFVSTIDKDGRDKGYLNRIAINAPIQGTAADIIKLAMINIYVKITKNKMPLSMIMQIHDELVFECDVNFRQEAEKFIKEEMENVVKLSLPLMVDVGTGNSWADAH